MNRLPLLHLSALALAALAASCDPGALERAGELELDERAGALELDELAAPPPAAGDGDYHGPDPAFFDPQVSETIDCTESQDTGYVQGNPYPITVVTVDGKKVEKDTANAFWVMREAAAADGVNIKVVSGFRTYAEQQYLYDCYKKCNCNNCNLAAKPGYSNHQSGHALDLNTSQGGVYSWLAAHGGSYGFTETVQGEPWHWEYWGGGPGGGPCGVCEPHCEGSKIIGEDCGVGDCGAYGADCVDDDLGVRCVFFACPPQGQVKVCVDQDTIGTCNDGQIETGDCSAFAAYCSTQYGDEAVCASWFCSSPEELAIPHDGCFFLDGQPFHCDEQGQIHHMECPPGEKCSVYPAVHCEADNGCPEAGEASICIDGVAIGQCAEGAVVSAQDCADFGGFCSTAGGAAPHCVSSFCVSDPDDVPYEHSVCLPDGNLGHCQNDGSMKTSECPEGSVCAAEEGHDAACVQGEETTGGETDGGSGSGSGTGGETEGGSDSGTTAGSSGASGSGAPTITASDTDSDSDGADEPEGCGCASGGRGAPAWGLALLALLGLRRRR